MWVFLRAGYEVAGRIEGVWWSLIRPSLSWRPGTDRRAFSTVGLTYSHHNHAQRGGKPVKIDVLLWGVNLLLVLSHAHLSARRTELGLNARLRYTAIHRFAAVGWNAEEDRVVAGLGRLLQVRVGQDMEDGRRGMSGRASAVSE
jgi:hypothetical protein